MIDNKDIQSIVEQIRAELLPIGSILIFASEKLPQGFMPCDGRELSKQQYPELYALIRGTWGESPSSFYLPDLQGQFIRGWDKEGDIDPQRKFGAAQSDSLQGHGHQIVFANNIETNSAGEHRHKVYYKSHKVANDGMFSSSWTVYEVSYSNCDESIARDGTGTTGGGSHTHSITLPKDFMQIKDPEASIYGIPRIAAETRPKNVALMFCIKVK